MEIHLPKSTIRSWTISDAPAFLKHGRNPNIWKNLREDFPNGFDRSFAETSMRNIKDANPESWFAIDVRGEAVGMIGVRLASGPFRLSAELGYWLGEDYWGAGITSEAVRAFTEYAMSRYQLRRIFAFVFEWNPASMRVLQKCEYVSEGVLRQSLVKNGCVIDQVLYAHVNSLVSSQTLEPETKTVFSQ